MISTTTQYLGTQLRSLLVRTKTNMTDTSICNKINKIDGQRKIFWVSSVGISIALIVCGVCTWMFSNTNVYSPIVESAAAGKTSRERTGTSVSLHPTSYPTLNASDKQERSNSFPSSSPLLPSIVLWPSNSEPNLSGLRATAPPSNPTLDPSEVPSLWPTEQPSLHPSYEPSRNPSLSPTMKSSEVPSTIPSTSLMLGPSMFPSSLSTSSLSPSTTVSPSDEPLFKSHDEPVYPNPTYFNYDTRPDSKYGPNSWENVALLNTTNNYWQEFGFVENKCGVGAQSPIDLCVEPIRKCMEKHEFRSRPGEVTIDGYFTDKQILPNKLRVVYARRQGDEPVPPHTDFSGVGYRALDMLNIDIKFPSEHTLCGHVYDGEMNYFFYHPVRKVLIGIAWLFKVHEVNATNDHMQLLIDEFQQIFDANEDACNPSITAPNGTMSEDTYLSRRNLKKSKRWDPFHVDIQKTIHFWGYTGSLTEPPCTDAVLWRVMDVPVMISIEQLNQMKNILFNNRNHDTCTFTSTHFNGRVARPLAHPLRYYKCTRSNYVSDDERDLCGNAGCDVPFGKDLEPYVEPDAFVTDSPTISPLY